MEIQARIISAAMVILGMTSIDEKPANFPISEGVTHGHALPRQLYLLKIASQIVDKFVVDKILIQDLMNSILTTQEQEEMVNRQDLTADGRFPCRSQGCDKSFKYDGKRRRNHELTHDLPPMLPENQTLSSEFPTQKTPTKCMNDDAFNYNCSVLNEGLLLMNFLDSTAEGDGERSIRCWKFFLLHFKQEKSTTKYALEALYLLLQVNALLPPDQAHNLIWNRTINNKGGLGKNVALDLDIVHDNNYLKQAIKNLGPNVTPKAVMRISNAQRVTKQIINNLDNECLIKKKSGKHVSADYSKDLRTIVNLLMEEAVFTHTPGRRYTCFPKFARDQLSMLDISSMFHWINKHKKNIDTGRKAR